jgi:hypothetical protein
MDETAKVGLVMLEGDSKPAPFEKPNSKGCATRNPLGDRSLPHPPANGTVTDAQFVGFTYPSCLGSNDHHSYTQNFSVSVAGVNYNLSTTVSISNGNFSGTPTDNVAITTP